MCESGSTTLHNTCATADDKILVGMKHRLDQTKKASPCPSASVPLPLCLPDSFPMSSPVPVPPVSPCLGFPVSQSACKLKPPCVPLRLFRSPCVSQDESPCLPLGLSPLCRPAYVPLCPPSTCEFKHDGVLAARTWVRSEVPSRTHLHDRDMKQRLLEIYRLLKRSMLKAA